MPAALLFGGVAASLVAAAPASAQHTIFYADTSEIGRLDAPAGAGPLEPTARVAVPGVVSSLSRLPDGTLLAVGNAVRRLDPETLELTELAGLDDFCSDSTADADANVWCVRQSNLRRLDAGTYEVGLSVEQPGFRFLGIAALGPRLFAAVLLTDDTNAGPHLVEIDPSTGGASVLQPIPLPPSPDPPRTFFLSGMDFDARGDLWLGLPLAFPAVILPPPPDGYVARVLDPLAGAVAQDAQRIEGTSSPTPLVIGAPSVVAVPTVGTAGLAMLIGLLVLSALAMIGRRPIG
ncbi:MAG: hypothetical protein AAFY88_12410 [Acidobacteriota bacterium]